MLTDVSQLGQEGKLDVMLAGMISQGKWKVGARLPAERTLAAELGVSRNTLRSVLKRLEARGMVSIRKGSGCYLTSLEPRIQLEPSAEEESLATIMARFEAAYLFLPELVALAAERIDPLSLRTLESCITGLGTAIMEKDMDKIKEQTRQFFYIIAASTDNPVIRDVTRSLCTSASVVFPRFFSFPEQERAKMFGNFVHIFRALKNKDPEQSRQAIRRKIINTASAFSRLREVPMSPVIEAAARSPAEREA